MLVPLTLASGPYHYPGNKDNKTCRALQGWLQTLRQGLVASLSSAVLLAGCPPARAWAPLTSGSYETLTARRAKSLLPDSRESEALLQLSDLFTADAFEGMKTIREYAKYVDTLEEAEAARPACRDNRLLVEAAWQVIANEFYSPTGTFSQAEWAKALLKTIQEQDSECRRASTYRAITQMVASLKDRWTEFLPPAEFRRAQLRPQKVERDYLEKQYVGVGVQLSRHDPQQRGAARRSEGRWQVEGVLAESPAEEAGLGPGDEILAVNGAAVEDMTLAQVTGRLRGPAGSLAVLQLRRGKATSPTYYALERRPLPQPPVRQARIITAHDSAPIAYIRLHYFSKAASADLAAALAGAEQAAAPVILDLRNNPGGVFEEALGDAALFVKSGSHLASTVRSGEAVDNVYRAGQLSDQIYPVQPSQISTQPIVILVNGGTASGAELLTGALRDNGRATVIGQRTFGKALVQFYFPSKDSSGLKVTVAKYLTPSGYDIARRGGLQPDVPCADHPHGGLPSTADDKCIALATKFLRSPVMKERMMRT